MQNTENSGRENKSSYLLEVVATNQFQGRHILLRTYREGEQLGVRPGSVRAAKESDKPTVIRGMVVTRVPYTNGVIPGQQEVVDHFLRYPVMYNIRHRPVIGEIAIGRFIGRKIALFTTEEIHQYFPSEGVRSAAPTQQRYANIDWCEATSFAEAEKYYTRPDASYLLSVVRKRYRYTEEPLTRTQCVAFAEQIRQVIVEMKAWFNAESSGRKRYTAHWETLAKICHRLDSAIQCRTQYEKVKDTLALFKSILLNDKSVSAVLFTGHCKILERVVEETLVALPKY